MRNRTEDQINIIMIRHGATISNREKRYLGRTDESLSEEGIYQLMAYQEAGYYPEVDCLFTSPMKRCVETAKLLYPHKIPIKIANWREIDFGAFEGKNYLELQDDMRYQEWLNSNGSLPFPDGESREEFMCRAEKGFSEMLAYLAEDNQESAKITIGLVVHGGIIMSLLSRYYGGEYFSYQVPNGSGYSCALRNWRKTPEIIKIDKL